MQDFSVWDFSEYSFAIVILTVERVVEGRQLCLQCSILIGKLNSYLLKLNKNTSLPVLCIC